MNNLQALIKCRNIWQWLAITGNQYKYSYKPSKRWPYNCTACMKAGSTKRSDKNRNCNNCVLLGYAWSDAVLSDIFCVNSKKYSYYRLWTNNYFNSTYIDKRKYYANCIVNACNKAIEDIIVYGKLRRNYFTVIKEDM